MIETATDQILWNAQFEREEEIITPPYEKNDEEQYKEDLELLEQFANYFKPNT